MDLVTDFKKRDVSWSAYLFLYWVNLLFRNKSLTLHVQHLVGR